MADNKALTVSVVFIAIVVLVLVLKTLASFLRPFVIAIILTFLLDDVVKK